MFKVYFVGAGTPTPTALRFGTCYVVQVGEKYLMFDCGPAATHKLVKMGLFPTQIEHLFFSHHHFDHNADYPCFLLCRWDQNTDKAAKLKVWGPPPTEWITQRLIGPDGAFSHDWKARVEHPGSQDIFVSRGGKLPRPIPQVEVKELGHNDIIDLDSISLRTAKVQHIEPWMTTLAYRLETAYGSLVISSDTGVCDSIIDLARGADHLIMHCWDLQERMKPAESMMITGTRDAARIAREAGVKRLILSHTGPLLDQTSFTEAALSEIASLYQGEVFFSKELTTLDLAQPQPEKD
ncbi:MAG: MBL fold metallo-hydrolase [Desulfarculaceae bacterium]|jgi:ribonuclease BN (tRNA processing enzyme)